MLRGLDQDELGLQFGGIFLEKGKPFFKGDADAWEPFGDVDGGFALGYGVCGLVIVRSGDRRGDAECFTDSAQNIFAFVHFLCCHHSLKVSDATLGSSRDWVHA